MRFDHWFRLFVRLPHQTEFAMPEISGKKWWEPYLAIPEETRPYCSNYTVADLRPAEREMDIDFVVHTGQSGEPEDPAAIWACAATPGEQLAVLDQGILFDPSADATEVTIVADESGLPAVTGILRSLPAETVGRVIQEVPTAADRRRLTGPGHRRPAPPAPDRPAQGPDHLLRLLENTEPPASGNTEPTYRDKH